MRVVMVKPGGTGYIGENDLYTAAPGRYPIIMRSVCTAQSEVLGQALEIYHNPQTDQFEVRIPDGVRARHHPGSAIAPQSFWRVVMVLPDGRTIKDERIPDGFWQRWDGSR